MATKKISELPLITELSGSNSGGTVVPVVVGNTTDQISIEDFSKFVNRYNATTASNNFIGNQTVNGNVTVTGNGIFGGNVEVAGMITAQQYNVTYVSSSVQYQSGSTEFGDTADDTHIFTGTVILNGNAIGLGQLNAQTASQALVNIGISSVTGSMNTQSSSQDLVNRGISSVTGSMNTQSSSQDLVNRRISSTTGSINTTTSSFDSVFLRISSTTGSMNTQSSSQDLVNMGISSVTGSINTTTSSFDSVFLRISSTTGSINTTTSSFNSVFLGISSVTGAMNTQSSSQDLVNRQISSTTGSINTTTSSFDSVFLRISSTTGSINKQSGSQDLVNLGISTYTGSQNVINSSVDAHILGISTYTASATTTNTSIDAHILAQSRQTASQDLVNYQNSIVTSSFRNEIGGIEDYTASLKSAIIVNGSSVRIIGELTASRIYTEFITSSVLFVTGSNIIGDQSTDKHEFTGSVNINDTLFIKGQAIGLGELNAFTGSQINKDFTLSKVTASIDASILGVSKQTGSQDLVNLGISTYTGSQNIINTSIDAHILKQATQTGSQDLVNLGISTFTGSLRSELNLIEAYTASLKAAAIVSSSQQIQNYNLFAVTSSANTFYDTQTISGSLRVNGPLRGNIISGGLDVNGGITGSVKGNLAGVADYASTVAVANTGTTTDTSLFPIFSLSPVLASYTSLYSHASSSFFFNGVTRRLHMEGFVVSGSNNIAEISGSLIVNGGITGSLMATNGVVSSSAQITELTQIAPIQAYTASLKSAFTVSGTTTTHNGPVNLSDNTIYSYFSQPANVTSGNTTVYTYTQTSGEYCVGFEYSIMGLYAPSGTNLFGIAHGYAFFMADGSTNASYKSATAENGWSVAVAASNAGSFTITFTNSGGATMSNINLRVRKINRTGLG